MEVVEFNEAPTHAHVPLLGAAYGASLHRMLVPTSVHYGGGPPDARSREKPGFAASSGRGLELRTRGGGHAW